MRILKILISFLYIYFLSISIVSAKSIAVFSDDDFSKKVKSTAFEKTFLKKNELLNLSTKNYSVLLLNKYSFLDEAIFLSIKKFINNEGKLILIFPTNAEDYCNFAKLAEILGVKFEGVKTLNNETDINWIEKTLEKNHLQKETKVASLTLLNNSIHLAVFGDIEKHETAISYSKNGSVVAWEMFKKADIKFNEKSLQYILKNYFPKTSNKIDYFHSDYDETLLELEKNRKYISNYQDNIINYSEDIALAQESLEKAKISELQAIYSSNTGDKKASKKHIENSKHYMRKSTNGLNNISPAENRGIWFDRGTIVEIKNKAEMANYFDKLASAGINTVYFETLNAGYTIYPSKIATQNPLTNGRDPLLWAIDEAHKRNIKLQAWLWIFAVGNDRHNKIINKPDNYTGPILEKNMRFALLGENGNFRPKKQPEFWLDPSNKEAVNYLLKIIDELISNYDIDGIQLDYIRYPFQNPDNLMGFNHNSVAQFVANTGEKLFVNDMQSNKLWNLWKEDNINSFVKKVSTQVKKQKPNIKISAAIFSKKPDERLASIQQNYEYWLENGYVDFLTPMSYSISEEALRKNLNTLNSQDNSWLIYPGVALQHVDDIGILKQMAIIRENGFAGISFFAVAQLNKEKTNLMNDAGFNQNTTDTTDNLISSVKLFINDYIKSLIMINIMDYTLSQEQKTLLASMQAQAHTTLYYINNSQLLLALKNIELLEDETSKFFQNYSTYNPIRYQTINSYINRAKTLLKIAMKDKTNY